MNDDELIVAEVLKGFEVLVQRLFDANRRFAYRHMSTRLDISGTPHRMADFRILEAEGD